MENLVSNTSGEISRKTKKPKISFKMRMLMKIFLNQKAKFKADKSAERQCEHLKKITGASKFTAIPKKVFQKYEVVKKDYDGHFCYFLYPKKFIAQKYLVYLHGGAYFLEMNKLQWNFIAKLGELTNANICIPLYPLAPEYNYTHTFPMLRKVYQDLNNENKDHLPINLIGDSSGGGITLSFAEMIRNENMPLAKNVILLSPSVDMTPLKPEEQATANAIEPYDCMLSQKIADLIIEWWCGKEDHYHYFASPIFGGLKGLNNIWVFTSTYDLLNIVARRFKKQAETENVPIHYIERLYLPHVWMLFTFTREGKQEINNIAKIINEH